MSGQGLAAHRLQPLLAPRSIAVIGASPSPGTFGNDLLGAMTRVPYPGPVSRINPRYRGQEKDYFGAISELPQTPDLAVIAVGNERLERTLRECIDKGTRAAAIFANCYVADDTPPSLLERVRAMALEAGLAICGANCMGFYNFDADVHVCAYPRDYYRQGPVCLIAQSGSVFSALVHNGRHLDFNLAVSSGQELTTSAADYIDYALDMPTTRAIGLFLESVRDPAGFVATLERAQALDVPIVVLKVGRTARSAAFALSHTGALAGNDDAFSALCDKYGVSQVRTLDEMAASLTLLSHPLRPAQGRGIAAMLDSGGIREMLVDLAEDAGVEFGEIGETTRARLAPLLAPGLDPVNPLDAYGTGHDLAASFASCLAALTDDDEVALGVFFVDIRFGSGAAQAYAEAAMRAAPKVKKPLALATNYSSDDCDDLALALHRHGVAFLNGTVPALHATRHALAYRDHRRQLHDVSVPATDPRLVAEMRGKLAHPTPLVEADAMPLLRSYGIAMPGQRLVRSLGEAGEAAGELGYPVVLKTAAAGILHKTERQGVMLDIRNEASLAAAYEDLASRLGPEVLVAAQIPAGIELSFGAFHDRQFGPVVSLGAGGVLIELLRDQAYAIPPISQEAALRLLARLQLDKLFDGLRGAQPIDRRPVAAAFSGFSRLVADLGETLAEADVNPVRATHAGCYALDVVLVPRHT